MSNGTYDIIIIGASHTLVLAMLGMVLAANDTCLNIF
jgi:hypothetical protein